MWQTFASLQYVLYWNSLALVVVFIFFIHFIRFYHGVHPRARGISPSKRIIYWQLFNCCRDFVFILGSPSRVCLLFMVLFLPLPRIYMFKGKCLLHSYRPCRILFCLFKSFACHKNRRNISLCMMFVPVGL